MLITYSCEIFIICAVLALLIFNSALAYNIFYKYPVLNYEILYQIFTIVVISLFLLINTEITQINYDFFYFTSSSTQNLKILVVTIFLFFFILIWRSFTIQKLNFFEYFIILLLALVSLLFLISSYNFISIYISLEILALSSYILAAFNKNSIFSSEAGLKYFISSSLISGFFLLGISFIYGSLGTINLYQIEFLILNFFDVSNGFSFSFFFCGCILIICSLLFKLVIAPFHFWFPQIYDGSPLSSTIIFTVIPKVALVNLFIQIWSAISYSVPFISTTLFLIGAYSMLFGIFKMLQQRRLKKLFIYSSISNMGLLLCILIDNTSESTIAVYFFLCIYMLMSFLFWTTFVMVNLNQTRKNPEKFLTPLYLNFFNTILKKNYILAITISFIFLSFASIPPFVGFLSKVYIFLILLKSYKYEAAILLIYLGVLGVYYYIKFLKIILFENTYGNQKFNFYPTAHLNIDSSLYSCSLFLTIFLGIDPSLLLYYVALF